MKGWPRQCLRCWDPKPREAFPLGPSGQRTGRVCWACVEEAAYAMDARGGAHWHRVTWEQDGVVVRRCTDCRIPKELVSNFYVSSRKGGSVSYHRECVPCSIAKGTERRRIRKKTDGVYGAHLAELARESRKRPGRRAAEAAVRKRYRAKVLADPVVHARMLETNRINYRLRREREGLSVRSSSRKKQPAKKVTEVATKLPAAPLAIFVDARVERERECDRLLGIDDCNGGQLQRVCDDLGVNVRMWRRWRSGEQQNVKISVAEGILLRADVSFAEVWPPDDYPEAYRTALLDGVL
jgi:hypothetical protein